MKREITRSQKVKLSTFIPVLKAKGAKITLMKGYFTLFSLDLDVGAQPL